MKTSGVAGTGRQSLVYSVNGGMKESTQINTDGERKTTATDKPKRGPRKHRGAGDNINAYCEPPQPFSQFSNGAQTNRTKRKLYLWATCQPTIKLSVYESRFSRACLNVKWVYTAVEWHYLRLEHCQAAECHRTNLWVFFTTRWPCDLQLKNKSTSPRLTAARCRLFRGQNSRLSCGTRRMSHLQSLAGNIRWRIKS